MRYLITGHNGFKGSWLSLLLANKNCELFGLSLEAERESHFRKANLSDLYSREFTTDIRNGNEVKAVVDEIRPEVIVHLAAQPLVIKGYSEPYETFSTNVNGTLNVLQAASTCSLKPFVLVITTDKVYRNSTRNKPFKEVDCLGGTDPYSASKSMADILSQSWFVANPDLHLVVARAGNVIGGGDYSRWRLVPDLVRSLSHDQPVILRNPNAVRPWQHVLDCLNGYLMLIDRGLVGKIETTWNFGPDPEGYRTVREVADEFIDNTGAREVLKTVPNLHEEEFLTLDSTKAKIELGWNNKLNFKDSVKWTSNWFKAELSGEVMRDFSEKQVKEFLSL